MHRWHRAFVLIFVLSLNWLLLISAVSFCRLHDRSSSGSVDMQDFKALHKFLEEMNQSFQMHDQDRSGSLDASETHAALTHAGENACVVSISQPRSSLK